MSSITGPSAIVITRFIGRRLKKGYPDFFRLAPVRHLPGLAEALPKSIKLYSANTA
jgi:hypothetical protein